MIKQRGSILKGFLIYFVVGFGLLYGFVLISKKLQSPIEATVTSFFEAVKEDHREQAYSMLSNRLRNESTRAQFQRFLKQSHFNQVAGSQWDLIEEKGTRGRAVGLLRLDNSGVLPLEVYLILEPAGKTTVQGEEFDFSSLPFSKYLKVWKIDRINILNQAS